MTGRPVSSHRKQVEPGRLSGRGQRLVISVTIAAMAAMGLALVMAAPAQAAAATNWTQVSPATSPPARSGAAVAYDEQTGQLVVFGGTDSSGAVLGDTWIWNGSTWTQANPATSPTARTGAAMAYDAGHGQLVLFGGTTPVGGLQGDTWIWNGTTWTRQEPLNSPPSRSGAAMAYDVASSQLILFGGSAPFPAGDTWIWSGTVWTPVLTSNVPARSGASMAYDPSISRVVLFGGINGSQPLSDTWTWGGTSWTQATPTTIPPARSGASMAYDTGTGQLVLFGGLGSSGALADTWTGHGTSWSQAAPTASPPARSAATMAYDIGTNQLVLFGGLGATGALADTWLFSLAPDPPTALTATPGIVQVALSWTAPAATGSPPLTGYQIFRGTSSGGESSTPVGTTTTATTFTDTAVTPGTAYFYTVKAVSPLASSVASNEATATPLPLPPGPPTALTATPGIAQIALAWTAPNIAGNPAFTGYQIFRGTSSGGESSTPLTNVTGTTFTDTTTTPGTAYFYTVKAVSPLASSVASNEATATPLPLPPGPPTALTATPGIAQIALAWTAPNITGNPAFTGYQIFRGTTPGGESSTPLTNVTGTTFTDTTTTPGTAYFYTVKAVSPLASSVASNEATATPLPLPPGPPIALTATPGIAQIALAWTAPNIAGNPAFTGYQIFRGTSPGGESSTPLTNVTGTTFTDTTTTPGTAYFYTVKAVSPLASSVASNEATATPLPLPPGPPIALTATPGIAQIALAWTAAQHCRQPRLHRLPDLPRHHPGRRKRHPAHDHQRNQHHILHRHHHHPRHRLLLHRQSRQPPRLLSRLQRSHRHRQPTATRRAHEPHRHPRHRPDRPGLDRAQHCRQPRLHRLPDLPRHHPRR